MLKYMLDTNIVSYVIRNRPAAVKEQFESHDGQLCISVVTQMELFYGSFRHPATAKMLDIINGLTARLDVLSFGEAAAFHSGEIRADLAGVGTPIGPYDAMIAGHARSLGLVLVTNNLKEFNRVSGLRTENWV